MPKQKKLQPPQHQERQPGREHKMKPRPRAEDEKHRGSGKLRDKVALITGGDSGIGRAVAIAFAKEDADVSVVYLEDDKDENETKRRVEKEGRKCLLIAGDVGQEEFCRKAVEQTVKEFGKIDILVNNAAEQHSQESIEKRLCNYQHNFSHCLQRQRASARLLFDQGRNYSFYAITLASARRQSHSRKWRRAGSDLDTSHSIDISGERCRNIWLGRSVRSARPTGGNCAQLCVPCMRRFLIYDGSDFAPKRRYCRERL